MTHPPMTDPARLRELAELPHVRGATILTADGCYFDFERPEAGGITINAIARGLANTVRFGGQCESFYSVAEHSVHISHAVPPRYALWALLHDAAEAFTGDMVKPLKVRLPDFAEVEERVERAVFSTFGFQGNIPTSIKAADRAMLRVEQRAVMRNNDGWRWTDEWDETRFGPEPVIEFLNPRRAFTRFMQRYSHLQSCRPSHERDPLDVAPLARALASTKEQDHA